MSIVWHTDLVQQLQSQRFVFGQSLTVLSGLEAELLHLSLQRVHLLLQNTFLLMLTDAATIHPQPGIKFSM